MAAIINTIPQRVDITHYAGDTLTLRVTVPIGFDEGLEWKAQVRSEAMSPDIEAEFEMVLDVEDPQVRFLVLSSAKCRALAESGTVVDTRTGRGARYVYSGAWDAQVSAPGGLDPVTTVAMGDLVLEMDVTRQ